MSADTNVVIAAGSHAANSPVCGNSGHDFQQVGGMSGSGSILVIFCRRCGEVRKVAVA
jgi:hypothetical protein